LSNAGLYRGLVDLKASLDRWRKDRPEDAQAYHDLAELIQAQAAELNLAPSQPKWSDQLEQEINKLNESILELEYALIPHGLHVVGQALSDDQRVDMLLSMAEATHNLRLDPAVMRGLMKGADIQALTTDKNIREILTVLKPSAEHLARNVEIQGLLKALDGRFVNPAPGGDLLRSPDILPTGRNLHGFDPFKIPSLFATQDGSRQAQRLLERHIADGNDFPETVAMVLWGTDNLKTEGAPIAQALALLGAAPRFDTYGRLAGAILLPLDQINHPRVDVVISLSGIFRDLMPLQIKLLAEAAYLAASADEPVERNFVRKHALAYIAEHGGDLESASLRVFGNADGAYGSNVNNLVESGNWQNEDELAETYTRRKGFAYGRAGKPLQQPQLLNSILKGVDLAYQNLDSVELGVTTIDTYFDTLGGVSRAVKRAKGSTAPIYIGDQTKGEGIVRTINEQVALETHTRMLNPKWYEGMLKHGYEGVRQIESHVTNTMGWSATTGQVEPWVYQRLTQTYLLDPEMRQRLASLNPTASVKIADRLIEAHQRGYWTPDPDLLLALQSAGEELEDRLEGVEIAA
jgi:magnesium chelatase subunit H